ncbi:MAG: dipeptidase [Caulobacteraceae bacterium]
MNRRKFLRGSLGGIAFPMVNFASHQVFAGASRTYSTRVVDLVRRSLVIDMLAPLTLTLTPERFAATLTPGEVTMFRQSGIDAFHHSVGVGGYDEVLAFMAGWNGFVGRNSDLFALVNQVGDIDRAKAHGKVAVIMGQQDADHFRTPDDVKAFYQIGQRVSQLTYNAQNLLGSGSTERVDGGITDYGVAIIKAMNEVGMLIDVSHSGDRTTLDAIALSPRPIAITHSNCRALDNHPRLKTDEAIRALAAKGGVMGISGVRMFVKATEPTTVEDMVDHIDHVARLVGVEHVSVGSDADLLGYDKMPAALNKQLRAGYKSSYAFRAKIDTDGYDSPQKIFNLTEVLVARGYGDADISLILGGNFRRLLAETWR